MGGGGGGGELCASVFLIVCPLFLVDFYLYRLTGHDALAKASSKDISAIIDPIALQYKKKLPSIVIKGVVDRLKVWNLYFESCT